MSTPTAEESRLHEESLAGHREKFERDLRFLLGKQAWMLDVWLGAHEAARVVGAVLRHPIRATRYVRQNWRRR